MTRWMGTVDCKTFLVDRSLTRELSKRSGPKTQLKVRWTVILITWLGRIQKIVRGCSQINIILILE